MLTYREEFAPGTRVVVKPYPGEASSDTDYRGLTGVVVESKMWCVVLLDTRKRDRPNPAWLAYHNLAVIGTRHDGPPEADMGKD